MTPTEKAKELVKTFALGAWGKEHAISCVNEIIKLQNTGCMNCGGLDMDYWQEVITEINKL